MAEETKTHESFHDANEAAVSDLTHKLQTLEHEKLSLVEENKQLQDQVDELTGEIEEWRREEAVVKEKIEEMGKRLEDSEESKSELGNVSRRCADLEGDVVRLRDELAAANETGKRVDGLEKERAELERQVREYERKLGVLEMKESEERSKKLRVEEELREKVGEVAELRERVGELEKEKRGLEVKVGELVKDVEEAEKLVVGFKEKSVNGINGGLSRDIGGDDGSKWMTVMAVGSAGAVVVATALVVYARYGRKNY